MAFLTVLACGVVAGVFGVTTAAADGALGPHRAEYAVSVDHVIMVDLGPLGSLVLDSPLPWPLGVDVTVREIPAGLTASGGNPTLALADDLDAYLHFFAQPEVAVAESARALAADALGRVVVAWSVLLVLVGAVRLSSPGEMLRRRVHAVRARPGVAALVGAVCLVILLAPFAARPSGPSLEGRSSPVLAGTPLADARIVGRLGDFIDTYGEYAIEAIERNREFYDGAAANLAAAYAVDAEPWAPARRPVRKSLAAAILAAAPGAPAQAPADGAAPQDEVGAAEGPAPELPADAAEGVGEPGAPSSSPVATAAPEDVVTLLLVTDLHCNVGMAGVIGEAVRRSGAQVLLNAGDTVVSGTTVEQFCVDALAQAIPADVPVVVADGNHDSDLTGRQERAAGHLVLAGEPIEVAGLRILGDAEPTVTTLGEGTRMRGEETRDEMGERLADVACAAEADGAEVDILLVHNPRAGVATMASGCVPLQLSGHFHRRVGPLHQGLGVLYTSASTAGAGLGEQTIGPLQTPGVMTVIRVDPVAHRPLDYRILTVGTDGSVDLGRWADIPGPPVVPVEADLGETSPDY